MNIISDSTINALDQELLVKDFWSAMSDLYSLKNNRERRNIVYKHSFFVACRELTTLSLSSIGGVLGKDHATVLHAIKNHPQNYMYDNSYREVYDQLYDSLHSRMDDFTEGINTLIQRRINKMDVDSFSTSMITMYKAKIEKQKAAYELQTESLKRENQIIKKQLKASRNREQQLNQECLRLKNLL
jgi:hypothetical protein